MHIGVPCIHDIVIGLKYILKKNFNCVTRFLVPAAQSLSTVGSFPELPEVFLIRLTLSNPIPLSSLERNCCNVPFLWLLFILVFTRLGMAFHKSSVGLMSRTVLVSSVTPPTSQQL